MKVVICGSRTWRDESVIRDRIQQLPGGTEVITGGAGGADTIAHVEASKYGLRTSIIMADWNQYGLAAGPRRNQIMIDSAPDLVIAFRMPGRSRGTDDCLWRAARAGIPTEIVAGERV